jgi:cytochrome b
MQIVFERLLTFEMSVLDAGQGRSIRWGYGLALRDEACRMRDINTKMPARPDITWDLLIWLSGFVLIVLLVIAYSTGEEYPHTHVVIGYAIATVVAAGILWGIVRPHHLQYPPHVYSPRGIKSVFQNAEGVPKTLASAFLIMAALPLCAFLLMWLTHTLWGTTRIDEMHEVVAYFTVGLVVFHVAIVGIASSGPIEDRLRKLFGGNEG